MGVADIGKSRFPLIYNIPLTLNYACQGQWGGLSICYCAVVVPQNFDSLEYSTHQKTLSETSHLGSLSEAQGYLGLVSKISAIAIY